MAKRKAAATQQSLPEKSEAPATVPFAANGTTTAASGGNAVQQKIEAEECPIETECSKCGSPLVNVGGGALCPEGCGGLKPKLPAGVNRRNEKIIRGEIAWATKVECLRLRERAIGRLEVSQASLYAVEGDLGLWVRIKIVPKKERPEGSQLCLMRGKEGAMLLAPLHKWSPFVMVIEPRVKSSARTAWQNPLDVLSYFHELSQAAAAIGASLGMIPDEEAVALGIRQPPEPTDETPADPPTDAD